MLNLYPRAQMPGDYWPEITTDHGGHDILLQLVKLPWRVFGPEEWRTYSGCDSSSPVFCHAVVDGEPADCILDGNVFTVHFTGVETEGQWEAWTLEMEQPH